MTSSAAGSEMHVPIFVLGACSFESCVRRMGCRFPMTELIPVCAIVERFFNADVRVSPFLEKLKRRERDDTRQLVTDDILGFRSAAGKKAPVKVPRQILESVSYTLCCVASEALSSTRR